MPRTATVLFVLLAAGAASADEVILRNGGKLVGRVRKLGDEVVVTTPQSEVRVPMADVKSVAPGRTVWDDYDDERKGADAKDAAAQVALGDWCSSHGLPAQARTHWTQAIAIDPNETRARARLGFVRHDDRWLTLDEYRRARGLVKVGGEWVTKSDAERREEARRERDALARHERTIRNAVVRMASMKRRTRAAGKLALEQYAESIGDTALGSFATEVASYYNTYWAAVRESLVRVEVRATRAQLKRPVPTITTSLGAFSSPVTIQLPELSVVSVNTTVLVPADIELDEGAGR